MRALSLAPTLALSLLAALAQQPALATTYIWDGGGPSNLWSALQSTPGPGVGRTNWGRPLLMPVNGSDLLFNGADRLTNSNDWPR